MLSDLVDEIKGLIMDIAKSLFLKLKYVIAFLLILGAVLGIFLLKQKNPEQIETQELFLGGISISNWATWISMIAIPITATWAMYQYKKNMKFKQQEKATRIAKEFSQDLINKCGVVCVVYKNSSLNNMLKIEEKNFDEFRFFNVDELREIYENDDFPTRYSDASEKSSNELDKVYHLYLAQKVTNFTEKNSSEISNNANGEDKKNKTNKQVKKVINPYVLQNQNYPYHFFDLVSDVLNQLEYMCMDISSKATDSKYIYQSLHQMFLRTIRTLAVQISVDNSNSSDKFYTNIIHVYNEWTSRYAKDLKREKRKREKINKILNPKIKVV